MSKRGGTLAQIGEKYRFLLLFQRLGGKRINPTQLKLLSLSSLPALNQTRIYIEKI